MADNFRFRAERSRFFGLRGDGGAGRGGSWLGSSFPRVRSRRRRQVPAALVPSSPAPWSRAASCSVRRTRRGAGPGRGGCR